MTRAKRTWITRLHTLAVTWSCYDRVTRSPSASGAFARMVILRTVTDDGRELETILTPKEARELASDLEHKAGQMDRFNREHGNGWAADAEPDARTAN